jgi:hypothetical protein
MATQIQPHRLLTREKMEKLTTKRLLAYRDSLYTVPETAGINDIDGLYIHKGHDAWKATMSELKSILDTREHVVKKR